MLMANTVIKANEWLIGLVSSALIASTVHWEGMKYEPYQDVHDIVAVCAGYTGKDIKVDKIYTEKECETITKRELEAYGIAILKCISRPLKQHEYEAFTMFAYNIGVSGACNSRAVSLFNQGRTQEACNAMAYRPDGKPAWSYVSDSFVKGLHNRRLYERHMCLGGRVV